jgi:CubicO group peptidase (beta-lactamase class C family)
MKKLFGFIAMTLLLFQLQFVEATAQVSQSSQARTADNYGDKLRVFEDFVRQQMEKNKTPGMTIGFIKDEYIWVKGFGYADLENKIPAKAESVYRLPSVNKSMTAVAVLQLVEQGKINLDAEIQTYVSYFPKKKYPVTVRQLLYHLGGIPHYVNRETEQHIKEYKTTREAIAIFENFDLVAEPGTKFSYSSYGYNLLGAIIESASKQPYADYMRERIWQPLGMNATQMDDPLALIPNRVSGYQIINNELKNSEFINISSRFAAGGTRGTVVDLLKFMKGLNEGKILSSKCVVLMYSST